ncbi:Hypothetical predicted protein [Paramuricea clavata]|uniref:Uncharacterized protein n=1 Tax=Paramuricea clavata TaxID=317549 RepID=A0A7D9DGL7_PARCT|nr:Hypothetical predicted protein [Paramuricea clavata]
MEEISTAKDDKIEEHDGEHDGEHGLVTDLDEADITEIKGEEIENEFNDALIESEEFPPEYFSQKTVAHMVETTKSKIIKEKLYGTGINELVKNLSGTKALYNAVYSILEKFWRESNQDQLSFFVAKLFQTSKMAKKPNEELQSLLQSMRSLDQSSYISACTRGGLVNPSKDLVGILEQAEYEFQQQVRQVSEEKSTLRNIPID